MPGIVAKGGMSSVTVGTSHTRVTNRIKEVKISLMKEVGETGNPQ